MTRFEKWLSCLLWTMAIIAMLFMAGCGDDGDQSSASGSNSERVGLPPLPDLPELPSFSSPPSGGGATTPTTTSTTTTGKNETIEQPVTSPAGKAETCRYAGRFNGDRPTWYCSKDMADYPASFVVDISGCFTKTVKNNGHRYQDSQLVAKQSDVSGRGLALVAVASCTSTTASVRY